MRGLTLAAILVAVVASLGTAPAAAHTALIDSQPEEGATLTEPPQAVKLTFSEDLQGRGAGFAVTGPQGTTPVTAQVDGASARFPWPPGFRAGDYQVEYRVVSADGHVVDGRLRFTVAGGPSAKTSPGTATSLAAQPEDPSQPDGVPGWVWLLVVAGAAGAGVAVWRVRPQRPEG